MFNRFFAMCALAVLFLTAPFSASSQVAPSATGKGGGFSVPLVVGGGFSDFDLDFGQGRRMDGISAWADWTFERVPRVLRGIGVEAEGHAIDFDRPASLALYRLRQDTGSGGAMYHVGRLRSFDPYVKCLFGLGSIDFAPLSRRYNHDTFNVFTVGGGAEYRVVGHFWARGDYEFQEWHHTFGQSNLTPQGFTVGASYHFQPTRPYSR